MPPHELPILGSPEDWLRHAHSDLELARLNLPAGVLLEDLCFHAQQAAEKALKAVFVAGKISSPRTHSIRMLIDLIPEDLDVPQSVQDASALTDYAVLSRYPGNLEPIEVDEYREAVALAEAVVKWSMAMVARLS